uniref:O-antigen ligase-related domain-containing protein n=1 Tax=Caulobacter sp. (strain K31) TaxID=366602 RepID=B0T451_CAUSK
MPAAEQSKPWGLRQERRWKRGDVGAPFALIQIVLALGLVMAELLLYGGVRPEIAMIFTGLYAMLAMSLQIAPVERRRVRDSGPMLTFAAVLFLALLAWTGLTLTPLVKSWVAPEWRDVTAGGAITLDRWTTSLEIVKLAGLACLFSIGRDLAMTPVSARRAHALIGVAAAGFALWAIVAFRHAPDLLFGFDKPYHGGRLTASFLSANTAGAVFGGFSALAFAAVLDNIDSTRGGSMQRRLIITALWFVVFTLCAAALLFSASRAATLATALVVATLTVRKVWRVFLGRRRVGAWVAVGVLSVLVLGGVVARHSLANSPLAARLDVVSLDLAPRAQIVGLTLGEANSRIWQGHGLGTFRAAMNPVIGGPRYGVLSDINAAHNILAQWLLDGGVVGAALMFATVAVILAILVQRGGSRRPGAGRAIGVLAFSFVLIAHNQFDYSLQVPGVAALWALLLGLGLGPPPARAKSKSRTGSRPAESGASEGRRTPESEAVAAMLGGSATRPQGFATPSPSERNPAPG